MTQALSGEEKARLKRQWTELAIKQAQDGLWAEAVETNKNILNLFPTEPDALNRLGKAYTELGVYAEARQAYNQTLKVQPTNTIARKNLDRLAVLETQAPPTTHSSVSLDRLKTDMFIEETGKTTVTDLINLGSSANVATVSVGDTVQLQVKGHTLIVLSPTSEVIGQIEPKLSSRLISFMEAGNKYAAVVTHADSGHVRLRIREIYQHPSMIGRVSFPSKGGVGSDLPRAYIDPSRLHQDRDEDEDYTSDDEYYDREDSEESTDLEYDPSMDADE